MYIDQYSTSYGKLLKVKPTEQKILEYLIKTDNTNLNYEFKQEGNVNLVYITGCDDLERDIPSFDHPIITNYRNKDIVVTDVRKYITKQENQPLSLLDVARDLGNLKFCILNSLIISDLLNEKYSKYKPYTKTIGSGFGFFISHTLDMIIRLNPIEKVNVEVCSAYFMLHKLYDPKEFSNPESYKYIQSSILAVLTRSKYSIPLQPNVIEGIIGRVEDIEYTGTIDNLIVYLSKLLDNGKEKMLNRQILVNAVSNMWFGHGGSESILISLEHIPTWMSLLYTIESNSMFKKTRLASIISKHGSQIGLKEYVSLIEKDIKEKEI